MTGPLPCVTAYMCSPSFSASRSVVLPFIPSPSSFTPSLDRNCIPVLLEHSLSLLAYIYFTRPSSIQYQNRNHLIRHQGNVNSNRPLKQNCACQPVCPLPLIPMAPQTNSNKMTYGGGMPRIHMAAYQGDLFVLRQCIHDGEDVNAVIDLPNQHHHVVYGVTPLYLAAQAGHKDACEMLVMAGADVLRQCVIPESGDVFGATDIALVHFNMKAWFYLNGVRKQRISKQNSRKQYKSQIAEPLIEQAQLAI